MSFPGLNVHCTGCDFEAHIAHRSIVLRYHLADGRTADHHRTFGWCACCATLRDIEAKFDTEALQREMETVQSQRQGWFTRVLDRALGGDGNRASQEQLSKLQTLLHIASSRRSPPRCLVCGSIETAEVRLGNGGPSQDFVHLCGGRFYALPEDPDAPRFHFASQIIALDVEGQPLAQTHQSA
jgi:hypothetical protein